jgi:hypothetical protein
MNTFRPFDRNNEDPVRAAAQKVLDQAKAQETKGTEATKDEKKK